MKSIKTALLIGGVSLTTVFFLNNFPIYTALSIIKAACLLVTNILIGFVIIALFNRNQLHSQKTAILESLGMGMVGSAAYFFFLSSFKWLYPPGIILYFCAPLILLAITLKSHSLRASLCNMTKDFFKRSWIEYIPFLFPAVFAILPPTFYDSLVYALGLPNFILQNHGFVQAPQFMFFNMFIYYEILMIPAVFLGDFVPRIFHFLVGCIFILSLLDFASVKFSLKKRNVLLIIILSLPLTLFLLTTVKADLIATLFVFLGIQKYLCKQFGKSAIFWGFAVGIKVIYLIPLAIFMLWSALYSKKFNLKQNATTAFIVIMMIFPLILKNALLVRNPFFPFFSQYFPHDFWNISRFAMVRAEISTLYTSIWDILKAPYSFSFDLHGAGGFVGPVFMIFLPFLFFVKLKREKKYLLHFALLFLFVGPFFGKAFRYFYISFLLLSLFVTIVYERYQHRLLKPMLLAVVFVNLVIGFSTLERIYASRIIYYQKENPDQYISRFFPTYSVINKINQSSPKNSKILLAGDARSYYLKRPYQVSSAHDYCIFKKYINKSQNTFDFLKSIQNDGFNYIVFNQSEFLRLQSYNRLTIEENKKLIQFFQSIKPSMQEGPLFVYKLTD